MSNILYENGGIKFTILERGGFYHLDFYKLDGTRVRRSTKKSVSKENLKYIKKTLIPDIVIALGQKPTSDAKKEPTLDEFAKLHWELADGKIKKLTILREQQHYALHIYPAFGERLLSSITPLEVEIWQNAKMKEINPKTKKLYKVGTILKFRSILFGIFTHGVNVELIEKNPMDKVASPKSLKYLPKEQLKEDINPFTDKEMEQMLGSANGYMHNFIRLMRFTGIRPGEMVALEWSDCDFEKRTLSISKNRQRGKDGKPKTESSNRVVDLIEPAIEALKAQFELTHDKEKIFVNSSKKPFYAHDIVAHNLQLILKNAGVEERPLYNLRHTFASQMITKGVNILWVSRMLGHKDVAITLQVYAKFIIEDDDRRLKNIEVIEKMIK